MAHRGSRRKYGEGAVVEDLGSGYTVLQGDGPSSAIRVALRIGALASHVDIHRVKRAALQQLARIVRSAGYRYDDGELREREYPNGDGRQVLEFVWAERGAWSRYDARHDQADRRRVGDGGRDPGAALSDAESGAAHVGGARG